MAGTLHEDQYTIVTRSRLFLLNIGYVSDKRCGENGNTFYVKHLFSQIVPFEIMRKIL
jgi:hypothetical protein